MPSGIGMRIRAERSRLGLTQRGMAERGGVLPHSQSAFERETRRPSLDYLARLAEAGSDILYLLTGHTAPFAGAADEAELVGAYRALNPLSRASVLLVVRCASGLAIPESVIAMLRESLPG